MRTPPPLPSEAGRLHPEEKLLGLIRGKGKPSPATPRAAPPPTTGERSRSFRFRWRMPAWWLTALKIGLGWLVAGELVAGLLMLTRPAPSPTAESAVPPQSSVPRSAAASSPAVSAETTASADQEGGGAGAAEAIPSLAAAASRSLFQTAGMAAGQAGEAASMPPSAQAGAITERLTLTGIIAGDPPQAIIEDTQTKKTHFVTAGQGLLEGVRVEEVQKDRVVLSLRGEKVVLSL